MANIEEKVEKLLSKKIEELGYELYDVEYSKEGKNYFLRIFIDKKDGTIDLNDCEKVSNEINPILDTEDYIKEMYYLEVSSPGVERILRKEKHLKNSIGQEIQINLFKSIEGKKDISGVLEKFDDDYIYLQEDIKIDRKNISLMKLKFNW